MNPFDLVGKKLGDYRIIRQIAVGGMAVIYLGEDVNLGRQAAVKVLTPDLAGQDADLPMRFEREARAVAQMEHENIIPIFQFGQQDGLYFLAMRYVDGQDLNSVLEDYQREGKLMPPERAINILMQVAQALDYAHTQGVVHRDVKPSNVLLGANDKVYLSDFGLVLRQSVDTTYGTAFGTPRYISPEQATDSQLATSASDIYSLAVMTYEIFTGERLFKGSSPMEVALSHITQPPLPPRAHNPDLPANAQQAILRSLEKDPTRRHPTAQAFILDIKRAFDAARDADKPLTPKDGEPVLNADGTLLIADKQTATATPALVDRHVLQDRLKKSSGTQPKLAPTATKTNGLSGLQVIGIISVIVLVLGGLLLLLNGGLAPATPEATATSVEVAAATHTATATATHTATAAATHTATTRGVPAAPVGLQLRYTQDVLVLLNTGDSPQDISALRFVGANDQDSSKALGTSLAAGTCVVLRVGSERPPAAWNCSTSTFTTLSTPRLFWRADDAQDTSFTVYAGDKPLTTCDTVGRVVRRTEATCIIQP